MDGELFFYSIAGLVAGLVLLVYGLLQFMQKQLMDNTPTSKIRSIAMGLVEIYGEAVAAKGRILKSPFTNSDCVYYRYTVEEQRKNKGGGIPGVPGGIVMGENPAGFAGGSWAVVRKGEERTQFFLKDNTGLVLVDPNGAKVDIPKDAEFSSGFGRDPPAQVVDFLKNHGIGHESFFGLNKTMRYREYYIAPKDKLYVMGTAGDNPFVDELAAKNSVDNVMIQKGKTKSSIIYPISLRRTSCPACDGSRSAACSAASRWLASAWQSCFYIWDYYKIVLDGDGVWRSVLI